MIEPNLFIRWYWRPYHEGGNFFHILEDHLDGMGIWGRERFDKHDVIVRGQFDIFFPLS